MNRSSKTRRDGWRTPILQHFSPDIAKSSPLTLVADPDELLTEPELVAAVGESEFELLTVDDPVATRYEYEIRFRVAPDDEESRSKALVIRCEQSRVDDLPWDLIHRARRNGRILTFSLAHLFPGLDPGVLDSLDRTDLDALFAAVHDHQPGDLGANATRDFVLLHVFKVPPPQLLTSTEDLLRLLLERHYRGLRLPPALDDHLVASLHKAERFDSWPLDDIVPSREAFLGFLEERWPLYVRKQLGYEGQIAEGGPEQQDLQFEGPSDLPFGHDSIRIYIDNLFAEGLLAPTDAVPKSLVEAKWMKLGIVGDAATDMRERLQQLTQTLQAQIPTVDCHHKDWTTFASRWGEWLDLRYQTPKEELIDSQGELKSLHETVESRFQDWMSNRFGTLYSCSYLPSPVMVHQVAPFMAHGWDGCRRLALVVVDGLSLSQWVLLRETLRSTGPDSRMEEAATFAWVPTMTVVSRQSIFAAKHPRLFAPSIGTTSKEPHHWRRFWEEKKLSPNSVSYEKQADGEPDEAFLRRVSETTDHPACNVLGIVIGTVDKMLEGAPTGTRGVHAQVRHWADDGHFRGLIEMLLGHDFMVFVTSDHGNIEAHGMGRPNEGAIADERGKRAHVYPNETLRESVRSDFPESIAWPPMGLPEDYLPLLAPRMQAFVQKGKRVVTHGGISLEEVIVPFVQIWRGE